MAREWSLEAYATQPQNIMSYLSPYLVLAIAVAVIYVFYWCFFKKSGRRQPDVEPISFLHPSPLAPDLIFDPSTQITTSYKGATISEQINYDTRMALAGVQGCPLSAVPDRV